MPTAFHDLCRCGHTYNDHAPFYFGEDDSCKYQSCKCDGFYEFTPQDAARARVTVKPEAASETIFN